MKDKDFKQTPVAIIGLGSIFPNSPNIQEYWQTIKNKIDAITSIPETHWNIEDYFSEDKTARDKTYGKTGGFIPGIDFNPMEYAITPNALEAVDTSQLLGLMVASQALEDAGYSKDSEFDRDKVSVILGITGSLKLIIPLGARMGRPIWEKALKNAGIHPDMVQDIVEDISDSYVGWQESSFPGLLGNVVSGRIANYLDFGGTNCSVDAACGSSLSALHMATMELVEGRSNMVVTGGVDTFNDIFMYMCFSKTPALSPTGHARPFAENSDGTIIGEGLGMVVLKRLEDAEKDGDKIYAVIRGVGTSSDGKGAAIFAPQSKGQKKAMEEAYQVSGINPRTVELMEAHGTGTAVGDLIELESIKSVYEKYSQDKQWCALGSVKSQIGHTKAAAGTAGMIKVALALHNKVLPPTLKVEKPAEIIYKGGTPYYINSETRPWVPSHDHPRRASLSSFGFGGSNYHCVIEEYRSEKPEIDWNYNIDLIALSADTQSRLKEKVSTWLEGISWKELRRRAGKFRNEFNVKENYRIIFVVEKDKSDIKKMARNALNMFDSRKGEKCWSTPDGIFFGSGKLNGKLGVLFPGQGAQYTNMMKELACQFPQFMDILTTANFNFEKNKSNELDRKLAEYIYPIPEFDDETRKA
ncbi:MAG: beta-ketoacyl synthase N-terminal-like domain-containing protein, partial [Vulcanimicrobiota bacterium]